MFPTNYRVDPETGAVIFKKSAGRQKAQQRERDIKNMKRRIHTLEIQNKILIEILKDNGVITPEQAKQIERSTNQENLE